MESIVVPAKTDYLDQVTEFVDERLETRDCPASTQMQVELAVEEIFVNIASYAYDSADGEAEVRCEVLEEPLRVVIRFLDHGKPYDPLARAEADTSKEGLLSRVGGLGIHLVKKTMDDVQYAYEDGKNILTIQKRL